MSVLHARGRVCVVAAGVDPHVRGDHPAGGRVRRARRPEAPAHGRRAVAAPRPRDADRHAHARCADHGPGDDDQRAAPREPGGGPAGGRPATRDGQPRHPAPRADARVREEPAACGRARGDRGGAAGRLREGQAQCGRDPRVQRRRARRSDRVRPGARRRSAFHRIHGRRRGDALVPGPGRVPAGDPRDAHPPLRPDRADRRGRPRPGRAVPPRRRHELRHHRLDHGALLPRL